MVGDAADAAQSFGKDLADATDNLRDYASQTAGNIGNMVKANREATSGVAREQMEHARSGTNNPTTSALATAHWVRDNVALMGGLGIAIGGLLAASLPNTKTEAAVMKQASDTLKEVADDHVTTAFDPSRNPHSERGPHE